jgi:hypothetical protein
LRGTCDEDWNNRSLASGGNWNTAGGAAGTSNTSTETFAKQSDYKHLNVKILNRFFDNFSIKFQNFTV